MSTSKWGPWRIEEQAGTGGQGDVFKVEHSETGEIGALKRLRNSNRLDRFKKEIESVEALQHPNIVRLIDANITTAPFYAVFEYEAGGSLGVMSPEELGSTSIELRLAW